MSHTVLPEIISLWPDGAPGTEHWSQSEKESQLIIPGANLTITVTRNVIQPTLTVYLPDPSVANGTAVVICPGGGHHMLSMDTEGTDVAEWLTAQGVAAFVLKYRLIPTAESEQGFVEQVQHLGFASDAPMWDHNPIAVMDGKRALQLVRARAAQWGLDARRIGIVGFSAGGAVALGATTQYDAESRPDFAALLYTALWQELVIPADAPPVFLLLATDDPIIKDGSIPIYTAWKNANRSVELHIYAKGSHGFGMKKQGLPTDHWIERFSEWLQSQGFPV